MKTWKLSRNEPGVVALPSRAKALSSSATAGGNAEFSPISQQFLELQASSRGQGMKRGAGVN